MIKTDFVSLTHEIGPGFAERAAQHDADDTFVSENYEELKKHRFFSAAVPAELGGGDASHAELAEMLRIMAHYCSSTALAFSMHTHQVAVPAWRWRNQGAPVDGLLQRIADEQLVLVSTGGADWLDGSGDAVRVDGGFKVNAHKVFASGVPAGDILLTMARHEDPAEGTVVLHFPLPLSTPGVKVMDNWKALGMRGTGSHDVVIDGVFVPEGSIASQRPAGKWVLPFHIVASQALPLICAVYVGIAEKARNLAWERAAGKRNDTDVQLLAGETENELRTAQIALDSMLELVATSEPGPEMTNEVLIRRTLLGNAAIRTVEKAMELAGGAAYFRSAGLERLFRDVQAARYHPLHEKRQLLHTGRYALGLPVD